MTSFLSQIFIENTIAEYEIIEKGERYKAILMLNPTSSHLPLELVFWKENGKWKSTHFLPAHVLYQFGNNIDNQVLVHNLSAARKCEA
ncbi:MAG TPA: hypothetical protein VFQ58_01400 [Flavisolibacter sp.]|nr:hypothetical protein [Flavisolibacter sp.]